MLTKPQPFTQPFADRERPRFSGWGPKI